MQDTDTKDKLFKMLKFHLATLKYQRNSLEEDREAGSVLDIPAESAVISQFKAYIEYAPHYGCSKLRLTFILPVFSKIFIDRSGPRRSLYSAHQCP
jgi:hypothetical protein